MTQDVWCSNKEVSNLSAPHPRRYQELMENETCPEVLSPEEAVGGQARASFLDLVPTNGRFIPGHGDGKQGTL